MQKLFRKTAGLVLLTILLAYLALHLVVYLVTFPTNYPDDTLIIGEKITGFLNRITLSIKIARLSTQEPDKEILMPVYGIRVREIQNSWHAPRPDDRIHEGQDIFADKGTPVFSSTSGYIIRISEGDLGGNFVYTIGAGGRRYYYAHLDRIASGLYRGQPITTDTVLGFVGNTGNAENTPPHLHFGVYANRVAIDPLPLLINRP